jgi:hypothetical protein
MKLNTPLEKGIIQNLTHLNYAPWIVQYQSMHGALQWIVTVGKFDILSAVITMYGFRMAPRIDHLNRLRGKYTSQR